MSNSSWITLHLQLSGELIPEFQIQDGPHFCRLMLRARTGTTVTTRDNTQMACEVRIQKQIK